MQRVKGNKKRKRKMKMTSDDDLIKLEKMINY